jgi:hypothetical protein
MRIAPPPRHALITALTATFMLGAPMASAQVSPVPTSWLQLVGLLPAPTYDPYESQIPRRRPGHPPEPLPMFVEQNPDALNPAPVDQAGTFVPVPDRWRIMESLGVNTPWYDPYNQNVLKGDKPMFGEDWFFAITGISDTLIEPRGIPTPVGPQSGPGPGSNDVLGQTDQIIAAQTAITSFLLYKGDTAFKPPDYEFRATLAFNYNRVQTEEVRALQLDPTFGKTRDDGFIGVQELFFTKDYRTASARYDVDEVRIGIQPFSSDFRGFLFQDNQLGVRFFGNRDNNHWQYNLAWFRRLEKTSIPDSTTSPNRRETTMCSSPACTGRIFPSSASSPRQSSRTTATARTRASTTRTDSSSALRPSVANRRAPMMWVISATTATATSAGSI